MTPGTDDRPLLVDTSVLVDFLRGREEAARVLEGSTERMLVPAIAVAELHAGVRGDEERSALDTFVRAFEVTSVDEAVARRGGLLRREYGPSHGIGLADAVIAATALERDAVLLTLDRRHFPMLDDVRIPY